MTAGELVGRRAEEQRCGTGQEHGSDGADRPGRVAQIERRPGTTDHGVPHAGSGPLGEVVVEPYRVIGEPEHEVRRSASEHALAVARVAVRGAVPVRHPDDADEGAQRGSRGAHDRTDFPETQLAAGDKLEIVHFVGGG